jgi:hypothetical protein
MKNEMPILLLAIFSLTYSILGTYLWTGLSHAAFYAKEHRSSCFLFPRSDTLCTLSDNRE